MANPQYENGYTKIANEIIEALARTRIPGEARQVLDIIIRKTYGFSKKKERISTSQLIRATGLTRISIYRARKRLQYTNLISVYKNVDTKVLSYSFQKNYDKWKVYTKKYIGYKNVDTKGYKNVDTYIVKESNKRKVDFVPPSLKEVSQYCKERGNTIIPENFIDFYTSKGWLIGKNRMKDWHAAVRTWEGREPKPATSTGSRAKFETRKREVNNATNVD